MKQKFIRLIGLTSFLSLWGLSSQIQAQVVVGSNESPSKGSLLELKDQVIDADNVSASRGGLGLPRVMLVDRTSLEPFIEKTSAEWTTYLVATQKAHVGLTVYNLKSNVDTETDSDKQLRVGVYVWNGAQWELIGGDDAQQRDWFFAPSFNLPLKEIGTTYTYDLYKAYENQFNKTNSVTSGVYTGDQWLTNSEYKKDRIPSPSPLKLYSRAELDYVISWYDNQVIGNVSITPQGIMTYQALNNDPIGSSFVNLIFVVK